MPDLKYSKETALAELEKRVEEAKEILDSRAETIRRDIIMACEALPQAPEAFARADHAAVVEFEWPHNGGQWGRSQLELRVGPAGAYAYAEMNANFDPGARYRAFIFIHKIPSKGEPR